MSINTSSVKTGRFVLTLLLIHAVFFFLATQFTRIYTGDSFEYIYMALNIKDHGWFYCGNPAMPIAPEYYTFRPPAYSLFLMVIYLFTVNNWVVIFLQNFLSIFNIYYVRQTIKKLGYNDKFDWLLLLLILFYPAQFVNANTIAPDLLLQTSAIVYFRYFILLWQQGKVRYALYMSLALVGGMMIKPVFYPFAIVHLIILLLVAIAKKKYVMKYMLAAIVPVIMIFIYMGWNYQRTGKAHFSSTQSFNAVYYYYFFFTDKKGAPAAKVFLRDERNKIASIPVFKERYEYANDRGMQLLKDNFSAYMPYHIMHSARLLIDPGKGEWDLFTGKVTLGALYTNPGKGLTASIREDGVAGFKTYLSNNPSFILAIVVLLFNIVRLLGLLIFFFTKQVSWQIRLFVLCLIGYFAMTTGPIANSRYFIPVHLIAVGCAVIGYQYLLEKRRNKSVIFTQ